MTNPTTPPLTVSQLTLKAVVDETQPLKRIKFSYFEYVFSVTHGRDKIERRLLSTTEVPPPQRTSSPHKCDEEPDLDLSPQTEGVPPSEGEGIPSRPFRPYTPIRETVELVDLRDRREALGLSQYELAKCAGTSRGCIARLEFQQQRSKQTQWQVQGSKTQVNGIKVALEELERAIE